MANLLTNKSFTPKSRNISYLNKDFDSLKQSLVNYTKTYFPNTYKDFNEASPGMMFIELAAYVGDVLSYYIDYQFKESLMDFAQERKNLITLARFLGYKVQVTSPATTTLDLYQVIPSMQNSDGTYSPDYKYALAIQEGMQVQGTSQSPFRTLTAVDFSINTPYDPLDISVYSRDTAGNPQLFLLHKTVNASSGNIITRQYVIGDAQEFYRINLPEDNVIEIINIVDSDNNKWYEVDYLAQELVFDPIPNNNIYQNQYSQYQSSVPYILNSLRTSNRFITGIYDDNTTYIEFGSGTSTFADEIIIPSINTVGRGLSTQIRDNVSYDPSNFLKTKTYGSAPSNTTLTVTYVVGGGLSSNVNTGDLNNIVSVNFLNDISDYSTSEQQLVNVVRNSLNVTNSIPAIGGKGPETEEEIRQNGLGNFFAQNRITTKEDYLVRVYAMPQKYGSIAKAYILQDQSIDKNNPLYIENNNQFAINLYTLCYDNNKNLTSPNPAVLYNLKQYLEKYRMITDSINIFNGFIINFGVNFEIIVYKNYNKQQVLTNCITAIQGFFDIDLWNFNDIINLNSLQLEIANVEGVQSVSKLSIYNLTTNDGDGYSSNTYDFTKATIDNIVYPSLDPCIFELKYPNSDIIGRAI